LETETKNKLYEGMFLVDSALTGADWDGIIATIRTILEKAGAEIVSIEKWDDRRLAYDIKRTSRGTYILSYFRVDGGKIHDIEKSVRLSEKIMRVLILSGEHLSQEDIEKDTPASKLEKEKQQQEKTQETPAESVSSAEEAGEVEKAENAEISQGSEVSPVSDISPIVEDVVEKQPEQDQIEGSEDAGEKEQL